MLWLWKLTSRISIRCIVYHFQMFYWRVVAQQIRHKRTFNLSLRCDSTAPPHADRCSFVLSSHRRVNYLLSWFDVRVHVFEHRLEHGIVAHTQVLDLYLTVLRPVLRYLRGVCRDRNTGGFLFHLPSKTPGQTRPQHRTDHSLPR